MATITPPEPGVYDLAIIGGGINGVGIAADAAGRGLSVILFEQDDLASHTSSASSKLIHGGLRYLEHFEFRLVREALAEREVLMSKAPHIVRPLRFILPHQPHLRSSWMIRTGLFLYDHLGYRRRLPRSTAVQFGRDSPLQPAIKSGFEYSDCWVDDSRLVILNAMSARDHGAQICTGIKCNQARRAEKTWQLEVEGPGAMRHMVWARALVNAAGPWVGDFMENGLQQTPPYRIRLVQGSHIIVPRIYPGDKAFIMQNEDRRVVFVIPYLDRYTLIGTTDQEYSGDPGRVKITDHEIDYLLGVTNAYFKRQIGRADIVHTYAGVRPLCDDESSDPSAVTRDYTLALDSVNGEAPLLSVFGGKLTTYRKLAEAAMERLRPFFPKHGGAWTAGAILPGGEGIDDVSMLTDEIAFSVDGISRHLADRWATSYGSRVWDMLAGARSIAALGEHFGSGLYAAEVDYLREHEWARKAEDILWRRTKLGISASEEMVARLEKYLECGSLQLARATP